MSLTNRAERSLINHEEYEIVRLTHHPEIYDVTSDDLHATRKRLRDLQQKARTLAWEKRRISRGKAEPRGGSFPGTQERPSQRKQVFAAAVKRLSKEIERRARLEARAPQVELAEKALAMRRENFTAPTAPDTANEGMQVIASRRRRTSVHPGKVGRVSQRTKAAQARRDAKG
ncbi:hypothetical protein EV667_3764 [Ancylobacter aquaticus]|uniref:Uncharacterized protein n=1 Tax=Ancylobacter aquaticus TaxID=100 RepID=A0A4R1HM67_ANCAQ|nr:hypothetical protein [Ancylobacter aquaticus]TCK23088.1 hypothetical protein EV667_3764 [Ancylobacter aquaticus]